MKENHPIEVELDNTKKTNVDDDKTNELKLSSSEADAFCDNGKNLSWRLCGKKLPRSEICYFTQILILYTVILTSLIQLSLGRGNQDTWIILLSSCLGYILPSPKLKNL